MHARLTRYSTVQQATWGEGRQGDQFAVPSRVDSSSHGDEETVEIIAKVNEKGFFNASNRPLGPKNPLKVPEGRTIRLTFVFDEAFSSLAIGDVHQIAVTADDKWTIESKKIWMIHKSSTVTFRAGENGRKRYRGYCIVDCIGMEHLNNLVLEVVGDRD